MSIAETRPGPSNRAFRVRGALLAAGWTLLWSVASPAALVAAALGVAASPTSPRIGMAFAIALFGGAFGLAIAPLVGAWVLLRGYLTFLSMTAACLAGIALVHALALAPGQPVFGWGDMFGGAAVWTAMLLPQAWLAYWVALRVPLLRHYIVALRPGAMRAAC